MVGERLTTVTIRVPSIAPKELLERVSTMGRELGVVGGIDQVHIETVRTCVVCGCNDDEGCLGGCWWTDDADVCSRCRPTPMPIDETMAFVRDVLLELLPWQEAFLVAALDRFARPCPECRDGKPQNCEGWTLDDADEKVPCSAHVQRGAS